MIRRFSQLAIAATLLAGLCAAEQKTISGYLMDKSCSSDAMKKGQPMAKEHGVDCALMDDCAKSGFGVFTADGKFIAFDPAGSKRAVMALKTTKKKTDLQVTVTGDVTGDSIKVSSLKLN
jgi:hypothetical protein